MKFIENVDKKRYQEFSQNHAKAHFLQSYEWGEFSHNCKGQIPYYLGLEDEKGQLVAATLLLLKKTPLGYSYGYCPRGYLIDYNNKELLKEFTQEIKAFMQRKKIIYVKIDPDLKYQDIDINANPIRDGFNNYELFNYLISLGYIHKGFYKLYDGNEPRYTFRINLQKPWSLVEEKFSKSFKKSIKRSEAYNLEIDHNIDVDTFYELMKNNSNKDNFIIKNKEYYETFVNLFKEVDKIKFFNISCDPISLVKSIKEELEEQKKLLEVTTKRKEDIENKINRLKKELEEFNKYKEKMVVCSLVCTYTNKRAWSFYIGNNELGNLTFAVSRAYYEAIKDAHANGFEFFDLFGVVGDPNTTYKNLARIYEFKKKFGDEYIEFMGEFDLVNNKLLYKILPYLLKVYRTIRGLRK